MDQELKKFVIIYLICGNKGGVGKSTFARTLIELLQMADFVVDIIEADKGIPDVGLTFGVRETCNLHHQNGFLDLINRLGTLSAMSPVVISTPGGLLERALEDGPSFFQALGQIEELIGHPVRVTWVIDNKRDSVETLAAFLKVVPDTVGLDVVKNLHFADSARFELFNNSKTRATVVGRGGKILDLPPLAERIAETMTNRRLTIAKAYIELPLGERLELQRWVRECRTALISAGYLP